MWSSNKGNSRTGTLPWRHNECDGVSNHRHLDCLLNRFSGADQRKDLRSASPAVVRGVHWWPMTSLQKGPVTRTMFPFYDVVMKRTPCGSHPSSTAVLCISHVPDNSDAWLILTHLVLQPSRCGSRYIRGILVNIMPYTGLSRDVTWPSCDVIFII